jgi:hypothetical protein
MKYSNQNSRVSEALSPNDNVLSAGQ